MVAGGVPGAPGAAGESPGVEASWSLGTAAPGALGVLRSWAREEHEDSRTTAKTVRQRLEKDVLVVILFAE